MSAARTAQGSPDGFAGADLSGAALEDFRGQLGLVESDYDWITRRIMAVAERHAKGRIVSCLEGGYALDALARSVAVHLRALADL